MPCRIPPRPAAGALCPTRRSATSSSLRRHRGSSHPLLTGQVSRRVRARGPSRHRRTSPASRPAGGAGPRVPNRPVRRRPVHGRGLPRTRSRAAPTAFPVSRRVSARGPTRLAARHPASSRASRPARSGGRLRTAPRRRGHRRAGPLRATSRRRTASRGRPHPTAPRTACRGRRLPATRGGCLPVTCPPRTASGVPSPVSRLRQVCRTARSAGPTPVGHRRAGSCRATRRRPTASRARLCPARPRSPVA